MKGGSATSAIAHWKISQYKSESHNWRPISNMSLIEFDNNIPPSASNKYRNRQGERGWGDPKLSECVYYNENRALYGVSLENIITDKTNEK